MLAKDIMRKDVVTVTPYMTLKELAQTLTDGGISGAPVVDGDGKILGVVSQTDLVRAERESSPNDVGFYHKETDEAATASGFHYEDPDTRRVEQIMTPGGLSCDVETPVEDVARLMLARRIHRVLVTRRGGLVGIITTMDIMRAFLMEKPKTAKKHASAH